VDLLPGRLNQNLSEAVENRASAEMSYIIGRSGFWRAIGFGIVAFGVGSAIGIGLYGYSFVTRNSDNLAMLSSALSKALSDVQVRGSAVGNVDIQPHEIRLAKGQIISFDDNARLRLDPSAKIAVEGEVKVQTPTVSLPQTVTPRAKSSTTPTITNFTVFKSVPFEKGSILTGWIFLTSAQKSPTTQYCYYTESAENPDVALRIDVGKDQQMEDRKNIPDSFNFAAAFSKCVWFRRNAQ
jgi:hypothetical protein